MCEIFSRYKACIPQNGVGSLDTCDAIGNVPESKPANNANINAALSSRFTEIVIERSSHNLELAIECIHGQALTWCYVRSTRDEGFSDASHRIAESTPIKVVPQKLGQVRAHDGATLPILRLVLYPSRVVFRPPICRIQ